MEKNKSCYQYKKILFQDGLLNDSVDATYIIHLHNNGRYDDIMEQLEKYHPTNLVYIVFNQGYKKCEKELPKKTPAYDLTDTFLQIFKNAQEKGYKNILILEDDFQFSDKIREPSVCKDINAFLLEKQNERFIYYLGCLPIIQTTGLTNHNRGLLTLGTHSAIYSNAMREHIIHDHPQESMFDWDLFHNLNIFNYKRYLYKEPLCYQLFPETENSKSWFNPLGIATITKFILGALSLDTKVEPGYSIFYMFSKILFLLLLLVMVLIGYKLWSYCIQFSKQRRKNR